MEDGGHRQGRRSRGGSLVADKVVARLNNGVRRATEFIGVEGDIRCGRSSCEQSRCEG